MFFPYWSKWFPLLNVLIQCSTNEYTRRSRAPCSIPLLRVISLTVVMQQSSMFNPLLHVVDLDGLVSASCSDIPLAGGHRGHWGSVGMVGEVCCGCPLLQIDNTAWDLLPNICQWGLINRGNEGNYISSLAMVANDFIKGAIEWWRTLPSDDSEFGLSWRTVWRSTLPQCYWKSHETCNVTTQHHPS